MANRVKRTAVQEPQSRSKKTKTSAKAARSSNAAQDAACPANGDGEDAMDDAPASDVVVDETMNILKDFKISNKKEDDWPKRFGERLNKDQAEVLATLDTARKKLESEKITFQQGILPLLRTALAPIDSKEAPELEDESRLEVPFVAAGHQEYIVEITQLIKESHELVKTFDELLKAEEKNPPSRLKGMEHDFHKDEEVVLSTINAGRRVAAMDVDTMLADRYNEVRGRSNLTRKDEQQGRMLLLRGEEDHKEDSHSRGWGNVAADARKAVHKLQKVGLRQEMA